MKKAFVLLLCALAVFAIVSCKQDPPAPETFVVFFATQGGTEIAPVTVEKGATVDKPADPVRYGFVFDGWFKDASGKTEYDFDAAVTEHTIIYAKWIPTKIVQLTATMGIKDKKSSYEKFQLNIDLRDELGKDAGVQSGDVITLKFRTSRDIYDYDIRTNKKVKVKETGEDISYDVRWVYEDFRGTLADPVLGEDGWYTLTYTFSDSHYESSSSTSYKAPDYANHQYYNIGINFRGYLIAGDFFEIKDVEYKHGELVKKIPMKSSYNAASGFVTYAEIDYHEWTDQKTQAVVYFENNDDKYPETEAVVFGESAKGLTETGYTFTYFSDKEKTKEFDLSTKIEKDTKVYYTKTKIPVYKLTATQGNTPEIVGPEGKGYYDLDKFAVTFASTVKANPGDVITFKYKYEPVSETSVFDYFSVRGDKKWFSEKQYDATKYPQSLSSKEELEDGWVLCSYTFPPLDADVADKGKITADAWFRVDIRAKDGVLYVGDVLYLTEITFNGKLIEIDPEHKDFKSFANPTVEIL